MLWLRIIKKLFSAIRAKTVGELRVGVLCNVLFDLPPVPFVIANFLAGAANWNETAEHFYVCKC